MAVEGHDINLFATFLMKSKNSGKKGKYGFNFELRKEKQIFESRDKEQNYSKYLDNWESIKIA